MPRHSTLVAEEVRIEYIAQRIARSQTTDTLPIWEDVVPASCKVISICLDHLVLRVNNARTIDAQQYTISQGVTYDDGAGGRTSPADEHTFLHENESTQESQDHQYELLLVEAKKKTGRTGTRSLPEILLEDGWTAEDRPVITEKGVLINGNCRVSTLENLLQEGNLNARDHKINPANPMIEVKVVPTPATEQAIEQLERRLQLGTAGRLEYNWVQATTDMRRILVRNGDDYSEVHSFYNHLANYSTLPQLKHWLSARDLLDQSLHNIGMDGQQMHSKIPQFLFDMGAKRNKAAGSAEWEQHDIRALNGLLAIFLKISLAEAAEREMRYNLQEIKSADNVKKFYVDLQTCASNPLLQLVEEKHIVHNTVTLIPM